MAWVRAAARRVLNAAAARWAWQANVGHSGAFRPGLRLGPADVMLQLLDHELPVADDALDQITDRDGAAKLTIIAHRQITHSFSPHVTHAFSYPLFGLTPHPPPLLNSPHQLQSQISPL